MSMLKKKFSLIFSNDIEKALINVIDESSDTFLDEDNFERLVNFLENKNPKFNQKDSFHAFLKHCHRQTSWPGTLKALMTFHKLIHTLGEEFCHLYSQKQTHLCLGFKSLTNTQKNIVHSSMIPLYNNYLQKLSYNYEDLKVCFYPNGKFHEYIHINNLTMLHFLSKIQNMLNYLLNITSLFETSFKDFANVKIIKQFAYYCMTDCGHYYDFVNGIIVQMLEEIFTLSKEDAVFLYEIYTEHVKITRKTEKLFELRVYLPEFELKIPSFFVVNPGLSKQIQLHINKLKMEMGPAKNFMAKFKKNLNLNMDALTEAESPTKKEEKREQKEELKVLKTVEDLSKSMIQITTPNFRESQKKALFKAPSKDAVLSTKENSNEDEKENRDFSNPKNSARGTNTFGEATSPDKKPAFKRASSLIGKKDNGPLDSFRPVNAAN